MGPETELPKQHIYFLNNSFIVITVTKQHIWNSNQQWRTAAIGQQLKKLETSYNTAKDS
jgi:hypothetical protein